MRKILICYLLKFFSFSFFFFFFDSMSYQHFYFFQIIEPFLDYYF